ncbi:MAG: protease pro-enzyme activation domain-containing protein [Terracidiphilus sp.]
MKIKRSLRSLAGLFVLASLTAATALAQPSVASRVTQKVDNAKLTMLKGNVRPFLPLATDHGAVSDSQPTGEIMLLLSRTPQQQHDLDATVDQLHNRNSASFHQWLTPAEFGARFEPSDSDVAAVVDWLNSEGFTVKEVPPSKTHITFSGTAGQLRSAFHVDIHHVSLNGEEHMATVNEPQIPAALAPVIAGLNKLDDFRPKPLHENVGAFTRNMKTGKVTPVAGTVNGPKSNFSWNDGAGNQYYELGPQDFYTVYNETPLLNSGVTGAGVTIAVIEMTQVNSADVTSFRSQFALPTYPATPNATQGGVNYIYGATGGIGGDANCGVPETVAQGDASGDEGEADLDLQWSGAVAPNAIVDYVACGPVGSQLGSLGIDKSAQHIVNYLSGTITAASMSYGECEADMNSTSEAYYNGQWEQFAAEGITAIISSGDGGAEQCYQNDRNATLLPPSVNGMGSSAFNVSAGGTDFGDAYESNYYSTTPATTWWNSTNGTGYSSAVTYVPETTWAGYCSSELFDSYLEYNGVTALGTDYSPEGICSSTYGGGEYREVVGGAGGISTVTTIPTWQSVYGVGTNAVSPTSATYRNLPDVSLFASNGWWGHFLPFCESDVVACDFSNTSDANDLGAGGTSFVAPQLAGLMGLINQATGDRQGQADYTFYSLAAQEYGTPGSPNNSNLTSCSGSGVATGASPAASCFFYDISNDMPSLQGGTITAGNYQPCKKGDIDCYDPNSTAYGVDEIPGGATGALGYVAGPGYDDATGLGSLNIATLVNGWNSATPAFASTTVLSTSASSIASTDSVILTGTVTANGRGGAVAPAGTVQFYDGSTSGTLLGSGSISPSCTGSGASTSCAGVAMLTVAGSALNAGSNSIVAYFEGDGANDAASTSTPQTVTVTGSSPQTIIFTAPSSPVAFSQGLMITLVATGGGSGNPVVFSIDGSSTGSGTIAGNTLTVTGVGTIVIDANQAAGSGYTAAPQVKQSVVVKKGSQTITFPAIAAQPALTTVTLSATASSGLPVTFSTNTPTVCTVSGDTASLLASGYCTVYASQTGNSNYSPALLVGHQIQVLHASQTITFPAIASQPALSTFALSASASSGLTVSFTSLTPSVCILTGDSLLSLKVTAHSAASLQAGGSSLSLLEHGTCTIQASQAGNSIYSAAAKVSQSFTVTALAQTITFATIGAQPALSTVTFSATASSGLTVSFASLTPSVCTVTGSSASLLEHGTCTIQASQAGNSIYSGAPKVNQRFSVTALAQTITFPAIAAQTVNTTFALSVTASSGLAVTFTTNTPTICTISGDNVTFNATGNCNVYASQPGNNIYSAALIVGRQIHVVPAP